MSAAKNNPNASTARAIEELIESLESITQLVQELHQDIQENEIDFAVIKSELKNLIENIKEFKGTEAEVKSLNTKVAVLEKSVKELEEWSKSRKQKEEQDASSLKIANTSGKWGMRIAIFTSSISLIIAIGTLIVNVFLK